MRDRHTYTHTQDDYCNPPLCAWTPRVNNISLHWHSLIRIINYHVLKQIAQYGYNDIYIKTDSKRTDNMHGPRTDEERIVNGPLHFIKRPVPFRFIKQQRDVFLGAYCRYTPLCNEDQKPSKQERSFAL